MSNFELIDDYLTNRLGEQEKLEFERQLGSDPSLKADVDLQKHIIEGVKKARIADLKSMLNNVPVGGGVSSGIATGKIIGAMVAAGFVGVSLYLYFRPSEVPLATSREPLHELPAEKSSSKPSVTDSATSKTTQQSASRAPMAESQKAVAKPAGKKEEIKTATANKPKIEVVDPSDELVDNSSSPSKVAEDPKSGVALSHVAVEADASNKKYTFHYQFKDGKLTLFGSFDKSLYEILEIHGDRHSVFLFYKDSYYHLDEKQKKVTALEPIKDSNLLKKLKEYRGR